MGPEADALRLRRALRDLVALSAVPAAWVGREPPAIAAGLADVLVNSLHLDFAFVRLCDPNGGDAVEIARGSAWQAFPEWLQNHLALNGRLSRREIVRDIGSGAQQCHGIVIPVGVSAEGGLVAAACNRAEFPTEIDQLLLSVAANHASTAFRTARILHDHRRAEEAIRESEQQLRKARDELETKVAERTAELQLSEAYLAEAQRLSHTGSLGWNVASGKLYWSEETFRIFECNPADEPTVEFVLQRTHPDERARVRQTLDRAVQERKELDFEHRLLMPDGSVKYVNVVGLAWKEDESGSPEFVGAITDITERKHAEDTLRRSEAYLSEAQRLSHTGSWAGIPATGEHTYWSEEAFRVLGFDSAGGPPRFEELQRCFHPDDRARTTEHFKTAIREKVDWDVSYRIVHPGGEIREIQSIGHPVFGPSGDVAEFVGTVMDVTERRRAEEDRQALAHANRITTMGQLTASIAHEVNQPIAAVVTNAQAALRWLNMRPPDPEEVRQALGRIVKEGRRAGDVIGRIRALVTKAPPRKDRLDINDTIREVIALTRSELRRTGTSLQTQLADGLPLVSGDRIQLQQVMLNLILNAVDAMSGSDGGSRELLISTEADEGNGVRVAVRDWGPGLKPESLDRLFDAFYTTKPDGMGMGLSICRSIIEAHGGRVWATTNVPRGAVLQFTLPPEGATASQAGARQEAP
jgi:PAS domain S-box-containing protein